jgi:hypothetical protein
MDLFTLLVLEIFGFAAGFIQPLLRSVTLSPLVLASSDEDCISKGMALLLPLCQSVSIK